MANSKQVTSQASVNGAATSILTLPAASGRPRGRSVHVQTFSFDTPVQERLFRGEHGQTIKRLERDFGVSITKKPGTSPNGKGHQRVYQVTGDALNVEHTLALLQRMEHVTAQVVKQVKKLPDNKIDVVADVTPAKKALFDKSVAPVWKSQLEMFTREKGSLNRHLNAVRNMVGEIVQDAVDDRIYTLPKRDRHALGKAMKEALSRVEGSIPSATHQHKEAVNGNVQEPKKPPETNASPGKTDNTPKTERKEQQGVTQAHVLRAPKDQIPLITPEPRSLNQAFLILAAEDPDNAYVFANAVGGGGKTFLETWAAFNAYNRGEVDGVLLFSPMTVASGVNPGAYKGNVEEKTLPYASGFASVIPELTGMPLEKLIKKHPVTYMSSNHERGKTYHRTAAVVDEAHNMQRQEADMLITRLGTNGRMFFAGDLSHRQNDMGMVVPGFQHVLIGFTALALSDTHEGYAFRDRVGFLNFDHSDSAARHDLMPLVHQALSGDIARQAGFQDMPSTPLRDHETGFMDVLESNRDLLVKKFAQCSEYTVSRYADKAQERWPDLFAQKGIEDIPFLQA